MLAVAETGYKPDREKQSNFVSFYDMKDSTKDDINSMNFEHYESFERLEIDLNVLPEPVGMKLAKKTSMVAPKV